MITWPSVFQDLLNEANFSLSPGVTTIETDMEVGPKKKRRVSTTPIDSFSCSIDIDRDDYQTFEDFYNITLAGGVNYFEFNHPIKGTAEEFRMNFDGVSPLGGRVFRITMTWELKP